MREGPFGEWAVCLTHGAQLTSFAASFLSPPELFLERRPEAEPLLRSILRDTDDCPRCRLNRRNGEPPRLSLSNVGEDGVSPEVAVQVTCSHREGGPWACSYRADVKRKVLLLGDESAHKEDLVRPAVFDLLDDSWRTSLGAKVMTRHETTRLEDPPVAFHIVFTLWDINGRRFYTKDLLRDYFRGARVVLAVCDLSETRSVEELGYWLAVAERIVGKTTTVVLAKERATPDSLPIAEARLADLLRKHRAVLVTLGPGTSHRVEHVFHGLGDDTIRDIFGTRWMPRMYS